MTPLEKIEYDKPYVKKRKAHFLKLIDPHQSKK